VLTPIPLGEGRFTVPGNRWDLLADIPSRLVSVSVVVPYYNQQHELDLVLAALDAQDYPAELMQIVVADDGSAHTPAATTERVAVAIVRQPDLGFRAAAARNLGAANAAGEVLCFLDADTVPQPDYIRRIVALPSVCPDALVVGRRRHADFTGWTPVGIRQWFAGGAGPAEFDEPGWLIDAYADSDNLLRLANTSYRFVISSVMCCGADLFREVGGFDESFQRYGGEDWEFAHRALMSGAVLQHARAAVAWHAGPDWAGRAVLDRSRGKNAEALAVARLVPDPDARVPGMVYQLPEVAVQIDADAHGPGSLLATIGCFLDLDVGIWVHGIGAAALLDELRLTDPRIRCGEVPESVLRRCRHVIAVTGRAVLPRSAVGDLARRCSQPDVGTVTARAGAVGVTCSASWARNRHLRWSTGAIGVCEPDELARLSETLGMPSVATALDEVEPDHPC
jgi:GT2 family glycosyltransferase